MRKFVLIISHKVEHFSHNLWQKITYMRLVCKSLVSSLITSVFMFNAHPFWVQLGYFTLLSLLGYLALKVSTPTSTSLVRARDIDVFFMSVSAVTVSSMSTLEMEVFSNTQLVILTVLMFVGGEVFTSMLGLQFTKFKSLKKMERDEHRVDSSVKSYSNSSTNVSNIPLDQIELSSVICEKPEIPELKSYGGINTLEKHYAKYNAIKSLVYVVLSFLLVVHLVGSVFVLVYLSIVPSARRVVMEKGLDRVTFSVFSTVSTFANCGFIPTNENMLVFKKNSGLLLILIPQVLVGNTLYPVCLRLFILVLEKVTKRVEFGYMLNNGREIGYSHLLSTQHCWNLALTVFGLVMVQLVVFCSMEWYNSDVMNGLSTYEKAVGSLFQVLNSRHAGESVFDLSSISSAVLVVFAVMMYLPPYTSFMPSDEDIISISSTSDENRESKRKNIRMDYFLFSPLSYLAIFVTLICMTERQKLKEDPLNFNVLNIIVEVISAYGNVGFSTGYNCERKIKLDDGLCNSAWYGFAGRWSDSGKLLLIIVMLFGRLKEFSLKGGLFWHLS